MKKHVSFKSENHLTGKDEKKLLRAFWEWILYVHPKIRKKRRAVKLYKILHYIIIFLTLAHLVIYSLSVFDHGKKLKREILDSHVDVVHIRYPI